MKKIKSLALLIAITSIIMPKNILAEENVTGTDTTTPIGTVVAYAGQESNKQLLERGYMLCDGSSLSKQEYGNLFVIIGTTYGSADNSHFSLPNLNGKTVVGLDANDSDFSTLGKTGGVKEVTLTVAQIPSHTHTFTGTASTTSSSGAHTHTFSGTTASSGAHTHSGLYTNSVGQENLISLTAGTVGFKVTSTGTSSTTAGAGSGSLLITGSAGAHTHTYSGTTASSGAHTHTFTASGTNSSTGGGQAHTNLQPYVTMKYIIKVK